VHCVQSCCNSVANRFVAELMVQAPQERLERSWPADLNSAPALRLQKKLTSAKVIQSKTALGWSMTFIFLHLEGN
jgi:hypothetical protein